MSINMYKLFENTWDQLPQGWLTRDEARLLWDQCSLVPSPIIIEVGSHYGRSTKLLTAIPDATVYAIDDWSLDFAKEDPDRYEKFSRSLADEIACNVLTVIKKRVEDVEPILADIVYLDGDHTAQGTVNQVKFALACKPRLILVHDVNDSGDGLEIKKVCTRMLGDYVHRVERLAYWHLIQDWR